MVISRAGSSAAAGNALSQSWASNSNFMSSYKVSGIFVLSDFKQNRKVSTSSSKSS